MPLTRMRTIAETALATGRPYRTVQTWARAGRITTSRDRAGRLLVDLVEAAHLSEQTSRRRRAQVA